MIDQYLDAEDGIEFDTIEEVIMTKCHLCGTPLEWDLKTKWSETLERPIIYGTATSCGVIFNIRPQINSDGIISGYTIHHS